MKLKWMILPMLVVAASACEKANFGTQGARKAGGAVDPNGGQQNPENPPLDVSSQDGNKAKAEAGGPQPGTGQVAEKSIELGCDESGGAIIEVGSDVAAKLRLGGDETSYDPSAGKDGATDTKGGKDVPLDKDGKPVGKDGGTAGKDDGKGGKGDEPLPEKPPVETPELAKVVAKVKGQFCPKAQNQLSILFVVDYSGSMGKHVDTFGGPQLPGNDPQVNGSCGRLQAAQALIAKVKAAAKPGDKVSIGMVPFAGGILNDKIMQFADIDAFAAAVSKDTFCQYVVQKASDGLDPTNPGGIDGTPYGVDASTNYKAAFTAAKSLLENVYGRKVVYFISDGEPTSTGNGQRPDQDQAGPIQAGIEAGQALRDGVDNLTVNALMLGNLGDKAQQVLAGVAGSADRVRKAENADQLATEIVQFPDAGIDEASGKATLTVDPYPRADLGLKYLTKDPAQDGVWVYETQPFVLLGKPGEAVLNVVEVTATGTDGSTHKATVKINYHQ